MSISQVGSASASAFAGEATVTKEDTVTEAIKDQLEEEKVETEPKVEPAMEV